MGKFLRKGLLVFCALSAAVSIVFAVGCAEAGETEEKPQITFDAPAEVEAGFGEIFELPEVLASDQKGSQYPVRQTVYDKDKIMVKVTDGRFVPLDSAGYTLKNYVEIKGEEYFAYTAIKIVSGEISFTVKDAVTEAFTGDYVPFGVPVADHLSGVSYEWEVLLGEEKPAHSDDGFVAEKAGAYSVTVRAFDEKGNEGGYGYTVNVVDYTAMNKGLVEKFDKNWKASVNQWYSIVNTASEEVESYTSHDVYLAKLENSDGYISFFMNPVYSKEYYQKLADEGFTNVSFWLYYKSEKGVSHTAFKNFTHGSYGDISTSISPDIWQRIDLPLLPTADSSDYKLSFLEAFDYIADGRRAPFVISNYAESDKLGGGGDKMTVYISDIHVTKDLPEDSIATPAADFSRLELGDTFDFTDFASVPEYPLLDGTAVYSLTLGQTKEYVSGEHVFQKAGNYILKAEYSDGCYRGEKEYSFTIKSSYDIAYDNQSVFLSTNGRCDFTAMEATLADRLGNEKDATFSYRVRYGTAPVPTDPTGFNYTKNGVYRVEITAEYTENGETYAQVKEIEIDLSIDGRYIYSDISDMNCVNAWQWTHVQKGNARFAYGEYTTGGRTEKMLYTNWGVTELGVQFMPVYSLAYYQKLAAFDAVFSVDYYVILGPTHATGESKVWTTGSSSVNMPAGEWHTATVSAAAIAENWQYINITEGGDFASANRYLKNFLTIYNGITPGTSSAVPGFEVYIGRLTEAASGKTVTTYRNASLEKKNIKIGDTIDLTAGTLWINGMKANGTEIEFALLSPEMAELTSDGKLTFGKAGVLQIEASAEFVRNGKTYSGNIVFEIHVNGNAYDGWQDDTIQ